MSLREASGLRHFLAEREIRVHGDAVEPVEHDGRRYAFSHVSAIGGYVPSVHETIYVFVEVPDAEPPRAA